MNNQSDTQPEASSGASVDPIRPIAFGEIGFWLSLVPYGLFLGAPIIRGLRDLEPEWIQVLLLALQSPFLIALTIVGSFMGGLILSARACVAIEKGDLLSPVL